MTSGTSAVIAIAILLVLFTLYNFIVYPVVAPAGPRNALRSCQLRFLRTRRKEAAPILDAESQRSPEVPGTNPPATYGDAAAWNLGHASGMGVAGPGANAFVRTALVDILTRAGGRSRVFITRNELNRLFEGAIDGSLVQAHSPQLQVFELLEDAIQHIEDEWQLQDLISEAEQANPDVAIHAAQIDPVTFWIATPGPDHDVVQPLIKQGARRGLVGVMFGDWPHGPTYDFSTDGTTVRFRNSDGVDLSIESLALADAIDVLRAAASGPVEGDRP